MNVKKRLDINKIDIFVSIVLGFIIFMLFYGMRTLNPLDEAYIYVQGGDILSHHMGWKFFRASEWSFPLGSIDNIAYPDRISVIYLDCIPWVAFLFKIISPILPKTFQYMGIYGLFCYVLQFLLGIKITRHFVTERFDHETKNLQYIMTVAGGLIIGLSVPMMFRVFYHQELASHYLILAAFCLWIYRKNLNEYKEYLILFCLGFLSSITHIYFVPIIGMILICIAITDSIRKTCIMKRNILSILIYVAGALLSFYLFGGFEGDFSPNAAGVDYYNANLNTLFNPIGQGIYLKNQPLATGGQYEGLGYLGLGWIILCVIALVLVVVKRKSIKRRYFISFLIGIISFLLFGFLSAMGNVISFNNREILRISYPSIIEILLGIFRSNGRFIWTVIYIFPIFSIGIIIRFVNKAKYVIGILLISLVVQITDFAPFWFQESRWDSQYISEMQSYDIWNEIAQKTDHIIYLPNGLDYSQHEKLYDLADFALKNDISLDNFYYGRPRKEHVESIQRQIKSELMAGNIINDIILVFDDVFEPAYYNYNLHYYNVDNYIIGAPFEINGLEEIDYSKGIFVDIAQQKNMFGVISHGKSVVFSDENSFFVGPVWNLYKGKYTVEIDGDSVNLLGVQVVSNIGMGEASNVDIQKVSDSQIRVTFDVREAVYGTRIILHNESSKECNVKKVCIKKK